MYHFALLFSYFIVYSFAGWLYELIFNFVVFRRAHWRGFLTLPLLPIYGFAALAMLAVTADNVQNPLQVFVLCVVMASAVELLVSWFLELVLHISLWDYTDWPFNFQGRTSLFSSLGFGVLGLLLVYGLQPIIGAAIGSLDHGLVAVVVTIVFVIVLADYANSLTTLIRLRIDFDKISESLDDILNSLGDRVQSLRQSNKKALARVNAWHRYIVRRLRRAFPRITPSRRLAKKRPTAK